MLTRLNGALVLAATLSIALIGSVSAEPQQRLAQADTNAKPEPPKGAPPQSAPSADERRNLDIAFWTSVQSSNDCSAVKAYLARFPEGLFVELARLQERRLCAAPAPEPAAAPAETPPNAAQPVPPGAPQLPQGAPPPPPQPAPQPVSAPPAPPVPQPADPETVRVIQAELVRVGCGRGNPSGRWSQDDSVAVELFNQHGRWGFDPRSPTSALLAALQRHEYRVCPLECEPGFEAQGNTCVALEAPPPSRQPRHKAGRHKEPTRHAAPTRRERQVERRRERQVERRRERQVEKRHSERKVVRRTAERPAASGGADKRGCRFVPRATGGGFYGDTIQVCN